jgi:phosphoserine phosphatase
VNKLAVFDFDSTLMDGETIDFLADANGVKDEVSKITELAMRGELDFFEALIMRVKLLEGLSYNIVVDICNSLPFINGAKETISELKKMGYKVIIFSGGFDEATNYGKRVLDYDMNFSNRLHHKNNILTGLVGGEMMYSDSKGLMIQKMQSLLNTTKENTIAVGDGANDRAMFLYAEKKIAFCAKEALKKEANIVINHKDLTKILDFI